MARLDVRLTAGVDTADVLADIRECLADFTAVFVADASWSLGSHEPIESPIVEAVTQTAGSVTGDRIYRRSATGGGDAKNVPTCRSADRRVRIRYRHRPRRR